MYKKPKRRDRSNPLDLDSLMDILSCLVGVMLFLVIYTVLELGSAAYQAEVIVSPNASPDSRRVVVLAEGGTVRVLDVRPPLAELLSGFEIVRTVPEVRLFVDASQSTPTDPNFSYSLAYDARPTSELLGMLDLVIEERAGSGARESTIWARTHGTSRRSRRSIRPMPGWLSRSTARAWTSSAERGNWRYAGASPPASICSAWTSR